jgi:Neurotransmitter-gated ion-channel ligand binding domain/Neurotransmitter-gated ion-channel transmembrane region
MLRDTCPCARQRRWLGFQWRHPRDLTDHLRTGCYSPLLRPDDLLNLQVGCPQPGADTSDPQPQLESRMNHSSSKTLSYWGGRLILGLVLCLLFPLMAFASSARALRPNFAAPPLVDDKPVTVTVGLYVVNLASVDEVKETFELDGYLTAIWQDNRLKFSPLLDLRVRSMNYREDEVWTPRLTMANAAEPRDRFEVTIRADSAGQVTYVERFVVNLSANYDLLRFPFDSQKLILDLQPSLPDRDLITLVQKRSMLQLNRASYVGMAQWEIRGLTEEATDEFVVGTAERTTQIRMTIDVKRRYGFYIWKVFLPLLVMVAVSWTVYWMNLEDFGNQILVAITTILTVIAFAFSIEANLPRVPYVTYIDAFFLCCYFFVFVTVLELMAVNIVLRRRGHGSAIKIRHVARWTVPAAFLLVNLVLMLHFLFH